MQASNILKLIAGVLSERPDAALREIRDARLWGRVALCAWRQRVGGLLLARLCELDVRVPDAAMRELAGYARHVREANAVKVDRVLPVVEALGNAGVRCVLLKGAGLLDLARELIVLGVMGVLGLGIAVLSFRKTSA